MIHRIEVLYARFASLCYFKQKEKCLWHVIYLYSYYQSANVIIEEIFFKSLKCSNADSSLWGFFVCLVKQNRNIALSVS